MGRNSGYVVAHGPEAECMIRIILWNLFLFLLPFMLAWLWSLWLAKYRPEVKTQWRGATYAILGTILVIISLVFMRFADENPPEGTYVPPRLENGQVVPGRFE
jgi:uncharacterized membrane protein